MTNHPLTDEVLDDILADGSGVGFSDEDMRTAYDLGIKHVLAKVDAQLAELRKYPSHGEMMRIAERIETHIDRAMHRNLPLEIAEDTVLSGHWRNNENN